jgi:hypothetical protein
MRSCSCVSVPLQQLLAVLVAAAAAAVVTAVAVALGAVGLSWTRVVVDIFGGAVVGVRAAVTAAVFIAQCCSMWFKQERPHCPRGQRVDLRPGPMHNRPRRGRGRGGMEAIKDSSDAWKKPAEVPAAKIEDEEEEEEEEDQTEVDWPTFFLFHAQSDSPGCPTGGAAASGGSAGGRSASPRRTWAYPEPPYVTYTCCGPHKPPKGRHERKYKAFAAATDGCVKHVCECIVDGFDPMVEVSDSGTYNILDFAIYGRQKENKNTWMLEQRLLQLGMTPLAKPLYPAQEDVVA